MNIPDTILKEIQPILKNEYVLFGSRSMASRPKTYSFDPQLMIGMRIDKTTDWDFSVPYSKKTSKALEALGYNKIEKEDLSYRDDLTEVIFTKKLFSDDPHDVFNYEDINIVMRNDHETFVKTWNNITPEFYHNYIWKRSPRYYNMGQGDTKDLIRVIMNLLFTINRNNQK